MFKYFSFKDVISRSLRKAYLLITDFQDKLVLKLDVSLSIHATAPLYYGKEDYSQKCPIWHSLLFLAMNDISVANFK